MPKLLNFIALQLCWLACVIGAGRYGMVWLALLATMTFVIGHFLYTPYPRSDFKLIGFGLVIGLILDTFWSASGLINYQHQILFPLAPVWIACLWVSFMLAFNHSLTWLKNYLLMAALVSAVSSPFSYYAAHRIGALEIQEPLLAVIAIGISWGVLIPGFLMLATRLSRLEQESKHAVV